MFCAKITFLRLWSCWRGQNRGRGKSLNKGRFKLTGREKNPHRGVCKFKSSGGSSRWNTRRWTARNNRGPSVGKSPSWQLLRQVHPPGPGSMMALGLSPFLWKSSLPTASQEGGLQASKSWLKWFPPCWIAPGTEQAGGALENILWAHWLYPCEYLYFFSTNTKECFPGMFPGGPLWTSNAGVMALIPHWGTKIPHAMWPKKKKVAFPFVIKYLGIFSRSYPLFRE